MTLHIVGIDTRISLIYQTEFIQGYSRHLRVCQIKALRVQFVRGISEMNKLFIDILCLWLIFCAELKESLICYEIQFNLDILFLNYLTFNISNTLISQSF